MNTDINTSREEVQYSLVFPKTSKIEYNSFLKKNYTLFCYLEKKNS